MSEVLVCGPHNSRYTYTGSPCPHTDLALRVQADTLGEALSIYAERFGVAIKPCCTALPGDSDDLPKHFELLSTSGNWRVDVHVFRGATEICPRQDLSFALLDGDVIELGELIC